uniref:Uncharacterized protein n=1 Tax=Solanum tuberosum TaxID=4113 RepID=M1DID8_SOLTU
MKSTTGRGGARGGGGSSYLLVAKPTHGQGKTTEPPMIRGKDHANGPRQGPRTLVRSMKSTTDRGGGGSSYLLVAKPTHGEGKTTEPPTICVARKFCCQLFMAKASPHPPSLAVVWSTTRGPSREGWGSS